MKEQPHKKRLYNHHTSLGESVLPLFFNVVQAHILPASCCTIWIFHRIRFTMSLIYVHIHGSKALKMPKPRELGWHRVKTVSRRHPQSLINIQEQRPPGADIDTCRSMPTAQFTVIAPPAGCCWYTLWRLRLQSASTPACSCPTLVIY